MGLVDVLYGDPENELEMRRLRPKESVVVRFSGTCVVNFAKVPLRVSATGSPLRVSAQVTLKRRETESAAVIKSNELEVTVSGVVDR